MIFLSTKGKFY